MAQAITDGALIASWVKAKQTNEQELLKRLYNTFNSSPPLGRVHSIVVCAVTRMLLESTDRPGPIRAAIQAERGLPVWLKVRPAADEIGLLGNLNRALWNPLTFNASDLSNLIRVIGAWLENGGGQAGYKNINKAFRPGVRDSAPEWKAAQDIIWGPNFRQRAMVPPGEHLHEIEAHLRRAWVAPPHGYNAGLEMMRVSGKDLCRKIDLLFGLLQGAGISGTTADTLMVLEAFGAEMHLSPGYYLFPVGTIAAGLHHTLLEAGLALALDDVIENYRIGFYTSLIPKGGLGGELDSLGSFLRNAEMDQRNRHFVCWYNGRPDVPAGCILWDRNEVVAARALLYDGKKMLLHAQGLPELPGKRDIADFLQRVTPELWRDLPPLVRH